jgi:hypothetical protein
MDTTRNDASHSPEVGSPRIRSSVARRLRTGTVAALAVLTALAGLAVVDITSASASTVNGVATTANPNSLAYMASGGSNTQYTLTLPANAACDGDTASHGYHVWSYLVEKGTNIANLTFSEANSPLPPSAGYGIFDVAAEYYGPANTASITGQIIGIPNDFDWGVITADDPSLVPALLYNGGNSGVWEAGLACANSAGALTDNWNTEVTFTKSTSDPNGFVWSAVPGPSGDAVAAISSASSTTFTEGTSGSFTPTATGTPTPTITESGALPAGVTFSGGVLSGDPTVTGTFPITFTATNGIGTPATQKFTLTTIGDPGAPTIGTATGGNASASVTFTPPASNGGSNISGYTVTATDSTTPANGSETGTGTTSPITVSGLTNGDSYTFTVTATNGAGTGPASVASNAVTPLTPGFQITTTSLPNAVVGSPYSQQLTSAQGTGTITWKKKKLPKGFALSSTGLLTGAPTAKATGAQSVTVEATEGSGKSATTVSATIPLTVDIAPTYAKKTATSASFPEGTSTTVTLSATGYPAPTITETGALPGGVTFDNGVLSGTPAVTTESSTYDLTITASNGITPAATDNFVLTVIAPLAITTSSPLPSATPGSAYSEPLTATGGLGAYAWKKTGTLPKGLSLSSTGVLSGTLSTKVASGSYSVPVVVTVKEGKTKVAAHATLTLPVS